MLEAVIVATARTPIGRGEKGSLKDVRPDDMSAFILRSLLAKAPEIDTKSIDDVIWGTAVPEGEQGYNVGRNIVLLAGLPNSIPGTTVNRFCASSLQAIRMATHAIKAGEGHVFVAGGVDSWSRVGGGEVDPYRNARFVDKAREDFVAEVYMPMIDTAENVAKQYGITRERMDEYALISQTRAVQAQENGFFSREITPYPLADRTKVVKDDGPRANTTLDALGNLEPIREGGTVTAGNCCPLNDGAAAVIVMSDERARELGLTPRVRIVASALTGVAPEIMGIGPIEAIKGVLRKTGMTIADIDVVELNEAFAAQVLPVCDETGISIGDQLNPHGGAIALGHPFGQTGARIMTTLINDLETLDGTYGLETMCMGGGMGMAMIVERV